MLRFIFCLSALVAVGDFQDDNKYEEVVGIEVDGVKKCLGAFVTAEGDSQFIVTSAHCVYGVQASRLKCIKLQDSKSLQPIQVKRVMVHPYYMPPSPDYDIALVKTTEKNPALLLNKEPSPTKLGAIDWNLKGYTKEHRKAELEERKSCRAKLASHIVVTTRMLCASTHQPISLMDGSVLVNENENKNENKKQLVGVGSYYVRGDSEKYPKIFTNITNSEIKSFIEKYID